MQLKSLLCVTTIVAASTSLYAVGVPASDADAASTFTIASRTEVPGTTLKPGDYSIRILDHLSDRVIVRIDSASGKEHSIFLGVPNPSIATGSTGAVNWTSSPKGTDALRGFAFPSGSAVEFVYPKAEAAALAKLNTVRVIAVDPESEGRPAAIKNLSNDDMQMVNLWMLSLTTAGPKDSKTPALLAQRYQPDNGPVQPVVAQAKTQPAPPAPQTQVASLEAPSVPASPAARKPVIAKLPKTGGSLPLVWLLGLLSLFGAAGVRFGRTSQVGSIPKK